jgi:hypothetical protein
VHEPTLFGDPLANPPLPAQEPFTNENEFSGIVDASSVLGAVRRHSLAFNSPNTRVIVFDLGMVFDVESSARQYDCRRTRSTRVD